MPHNDGGTDFSGNEAAGPPPRDVGPTRDGERTVGIKADRNGFGVEADRTHQHADGARPDAVSPVIGEDVVDSEVLGKTIRDVLARSQISGAANAGGGVLDDVRRNDPEPLLISLIGGRFEACSLLGVGRSNRGAGALGERCQPGGHK